MPTKVPQKAINIIKSYEGLVLKPYLCSAGVPTIGYGNTSYPDGRPVSLRDVPITTKDAEDMLAHALVSLTNQIISVCAPVVLNENELSALISFAYNVGLGAFKSSTLFKFLKMKPRGQCGPEFLKWNKVKGVPIAGLTRRRAEERNLFQTPTPLLPDGPSEAEIRAKLSALD